MTGKKVAFGIKPSSKPAAAPTAEEWVKSREEAAAEPMKRLTLDIPEHLHRAIKASCAARGTKMVEEIRALLEAHYANR